MTTDDQRYESETTEDLYDPVCTIRSESGQVTARVDHPATRPPVRRTRPPLRSQAEIGPTPLATVAELLAVRAAYDRSLRGAMQTASTSELNAATERLLADIYDKISRPLLALLDGYPRVALHLPDELTRSLPIETAHSETEPALFETTQLYRLDPAGAQDASASRPRRFLLTFHGAEISDLDVIALEQNLIRWVSTTGVQPDTADPLEPLIHVAGHDPTIPNHLVDPGRRAHVVLSGCQSLPPSLPPGVASAVGSLWAVDDQSSSSVMAAYHARLALGIGPVEALRQAQLLHRHLSTGAWASYVHIGAPI